MTTKIDQIKEYVEFLKTTDIEEIEIETPDGEKIHLKRSEVLLDNTPMVSQLNQETTEPSSKPKEQKETEFIVKSLMVGKFLKSSSKDHPPFVVEGTKVKQNQKLALIETMRIFRDVLAPKAGIIKKVLVEDGQFVEYGQGLFVLIPEKE